MLLIYGCDLLDALLLRLSRVFRYILWQNVHCLGLINNMLSSVQLYDIRQDNIYPQRFKTQSLNRANFGIHETVGWKLSDRAYILPDLNFKVLLKCPSCCFTCATRVVYLNSAGINLALLIRSNTNPQASPAPLSSLNPASPYNLLISY